MVQEGGKWDYLESISVIRSMMERAISESELPILGYDINELSSYLKLSPPSMERIREGLAPMRRKFSRSRFSPMVFKTDALKEEVVSIFKGGDD